MRIRLRNANLKVGFSKVVRFAKTSMEKHFQDRGKMNKNPNIRKNPELLAKKIYKQAGVRFLGIVQVPRYFRD